MYQNSSRSFENFWEKIVFCLGSLLPTMFYTKFCCELHIVSYMTYEIIDSLLPTLSYTKFWCERHTNTYKTYEIMCLYIIFMAVQSFEWQPRWNMTVSEQGSKWGRLFFFLKYLQNCTYNFSKKFLLWFKTQKEKVKKLSKSFRRNDNGPLPFQTQHYVSEHTNTKRFWESLMKKNFPRWNCRTFIHNKFEVGRLASKKVLT